MVIKYEVRDLLSVPQGYYLVHNISADYSFKGKVASQIKEAFGFDTDLLKEKSHPVLVGDMYLFANVFNLITKENRHCSVDLGDLESALFEVADTCEEYGIKKLAMPKLGTGGDRLDWDDVLPIIKEAFKDLDIEILICVLSEDDIPTDEEDEEIDPDDELAYAKSIDALILEADDIENIGSSDYNEIRIDKSVFDCFEPESYIDIYVIGIDGFVTSCYEMVKEDDDWIYLSYMGESRD